MIKSIMVYNPFPMRVPKMNLYKSLGVAVTLVLTAGCYQGLDISSEVQTVEHGAVQFPHAVALSEVVEQLPDDVFIENLTVQFEPGRIGTLLLTQPSRSADFILAQHIEAQADTHQHLRDLMVIEIATDEDEDVQEELNALDSIESEVPTTTTLFIVKVGVSGSLESLKAFEDQVEGSDENP